MTRRWRRLLLPTLALLPVLAALIALGTWQLHRLQWKTALLAEFAATEAGPAVPLADPPAPYAKVFAEGRFLHDREAMLGVEVRGTVLGGHLLTPLARDGQPPLLVDRGWVPMASGAIPIPAGAGAVARPEGRVRIEGYIRPGEPPGSVGATDDPAKRRFYTFDPGAIGAGIGVPGLAGYGLVALGPAGPALPAPAQRLPQPPNSHLGYVVTWYGLALAALGVFIAWARVRLREGEGLVAGRPGE